MTDNSPNRVSDDNLSSMTDRREYSKILRENSLLEPVVKNPFYHDIKLKWYQRLQLIIGGIFILPFRLICISFIFFLCFIVGLVMTLGVKDLKHRPLKGWRKKARGILRFLGRTLAFCCGFHSIKKFGKRCSRTESTIFVAAPHTSYFDAFLFFILGLPTAISRAENGTLPIMGRVVRAVQPILVTREDVNNKQITIQTIIDRSDPKSDWPQVLIFPEGTTTNGSCLINFKPGAFIPKLPVQPVIIKYRNKINTITWTWQGLSVFKVSLLTLCQFNNSMEVHYLPVYEPDEKEKQDALLYAFNVRSIMANFLNVITTNHSYEDCRLMCRARELNLPLESAIIEFVQIKEKLRIDFDNCEDLLKKFSSFARKKDGKMTFEDFCNYLELPVNSDTHNVFDLYDRNKDGKIDFREFIIGLCLISRPDDNEANLKLAFEMFNKNGKNNVNLEDFQSILSSNFSMSKEDIKILFEKIDHKNEGFVSFDDFFIFASKSPEYSKLFGKNKEFKILQNNLEYSKLASSQSMSNNSVFGQVRQSTSNLSLTKRPMSDKARTGEKVDDTDLQKSSLSKSDEHKKE
ncbi:lysophosphatidylcholine acyltransferase 2 [Brachionus plicatilis]|uniref:Lysophosphatidylcholine acyltransferase 2 n=1 Tax=Brachionus plicatilis TaxID=10195 RepID=A0A3M7S6G1_BRAPC|nr:lysophosphatidylcholine acyltransferase 2 [Brachionus plicatilis]